MLLLALDAFFVAFKIPNFLRRLFGEGAFAQAFVPVFSETREKDGEASVKRLIDQVAGRFGLILVAISILGVLLAPWIAMLFAPGFSDDPGKLALTADLYAGRSLILDLFALSPLLAAS